MHFKLIVAFVDTDKTDAVIQAAREAGATGATIVGNARGEGLMPARSFFGMALESQREVILFLVKRSLSRNILETICSCGGFDTTPGTGIALQLDVEDAVGVSHQIEELTRVWERK